MSTPNKDTLKEYSVRNPNLSGKGKDITVLTLLIEGVINERIDELNVLKENHSEKNKFIEQF